MSWTYIKSEPGLWTVGHNDNGKWEPESDHTSSEEAAERVAYLNGGSPAPSNDVSVLMRALREAAKTYVVGTNSDQPHNVAVYMACQTLLGLLPK